MKSAKLKIPHFWNILCFPIIQNQALAEHVSAISVQVKSELSCVCVCVSCLMWIYACYDLC